MIDSNLAKKIEEYILSDLNEEKFVTHSDPFWEKLKATGTILWLDTGDMEEAEEVWTVDMEALTTNNTLINKVIQKGIYDDYVKSSREVVSSLSAGRQVKELAFILNARHGLRLVNRFGGFVSVELHTDTAHDIDDIVHYGLRYHNICPKQFIIKVPYTASGLIGARLLREKGVKINFTLGFSARQNVLTAHVARPNYLNVFLGRIGAYIADNNLGDGVGAGEKTVIETQRQISRISSAYGYPTRLIAASLRNYDQLDSLAGVDLYTMPPQVAVGGRLHLKGNFVSRIKEEYQPGVNGGLENCGVLKFWKVKDELEKVSVDIGKNLPGSGDILQQRMRDAGFGDMFPDLNDNMIKTISDDGKIPVHASWKEMINSDKIAPDTLLNLAGLLSFTADQGALDARIEKMITSVLNIEHPLTTSDF
ncbi:MAG: transaldolase family protein [Bacteroidales bacterium]|nr:transaldolase family protein [Bacteroidales bacterium]